MTPYNWASWLASLVQMYNTANYTCKLDCVLLELHHGLYARLYTGRKTGRYREKEGKTMERFYSCFLSLTCHNKCSLFGICSINTAHNFWYSGTTSYWHYLIAGVKFYCRNCGQEGHRSNYCPEIRDNTDRHYRCGLCGTKGHNRRTCLKLSLIVPKKTVKVNHHCSKCQKSGHNRRTCHLKNDFDTKVVATIKTRVKRTYSCSVCLGKGHNARTCLHKNNSKSR